MDGGYQNGLEIICIENGQILVIKFIAIISLPYVSIRWKVKIVDVAAVFTKARDRCADLCWKLRSSSVSIKEPLPPLVPLTVPVQHPFSERLSMAEERQPRSDLSRTWVRHALTWTTPAWLPFLLNFIWQ